MNDETDAFARLKRLHVQGVLSDAEYEQEKAALMGKQPIATRNASPVFSEKHAGAFGATRWWLLGSFAVILLIGAYFFIKAAAIAEARGELGNASSGAGEQTAGLESGFGELCLLAQFMNIESLGRRVSALAEAATAADRTISWEETGNGAIARIAWSDQLAKQDHEVGIEMARTANASVLETCDNATEGAMVTRINVDGEILTGLAVGVALQQMLPPKPAVANYGSMDANEPFGPDTVKIGETVDEQGFRSDLVEPKDQARFTPAQNRLIQQDADLEDRCRGSSNDQAACDQREQSIGKLNAAGVCYGRESQANAEFDYHICEPGSHGYEGSPQARHNTVEAM